MCTPTLSIGKIIKLADISGRRLKRVGCRRERHARAERQASDTSAKSVVKQVSVSMQRVWWSEETVLQIIVSVIEPWRIESIILHESGLTTLVAFILALTYATQIRLLQCTDCIHPT